MKFPRSRIIQCPFSNVLPFDPPTLLGSLRRSLVTPLAGLKTGLLIQIQHEILRSQRLRFPSTRATIQKRTRPLGEPRITRKSKGSYATLNRRLMQPQPDRAATDRLAQRRLAPPNQIPGLLLDQYRTPPPRTPYDRSPRKRFRQTVRSARSHAGPQPLPKIRVPAAIKKKAVCDLGSAKTGGGTFSDDFNSPKFAFSPRV